MGRGQRKALAGRRGFTLVEAAMTTAIIGLCIVGMLELIAAGTVSNVEGTQLTTAVNLARNVRERSLQLSFAQVLSMNGQTYSPPIDSRGQSISALSGWSQVVTVESADPNALTASIVDADPDAIRVTVAVRYNNQTTGEVAWYRFASASP